MAPKGSAIVHGCEIFELCGHWAGTPAQANGLEAWRRVFAPELPGPFQPMGAKNA